MSTVGQIEKQTQVRVVTLFPDLQRTSPSTGIPAGMTNFLLLAETAC